MIHILKNKNGEFYWLSIVDRGQYGFEENGKSSEFYTQQHNCQKSIENEADQFCGKEYVVIDHTHESGVPTIQHFKKLGFDFKGSKEASIEIASARIINEINFVKNL